MPHLRPPPGGRRRLPPRARGADWNEQVLWLGRLAGSGNPVDYPFTGYLLDWGHHRALRPLPGQQPHRARVLAIRCCVPHPRLDDADVGAGVVHVVPVLDLPLPQPQRGAYNGGLIPPRPSFRRLKFEATLPTSCSEDSVPPGSVDNAVRTEHAPGLRGRVGPRLGIETDVRDRGSDLLISTTRRPDIRCRSPSCSTPGPTAVPRTPIASTSRRTAWPPGWRPWSTRPGPAGCSRSTCPSRPRLWTGGSAPRLPAYTRWSDLEPIRASRPHGRSVARRLHQRLLVVTRGPGPASGGRPRHCHRLP